MAHVATTTTSSSSSSTDKATTTTTTTTPAEGTNSMHTARSAASVVVSHRSGTLKVHRSRRFAGGLFGRSQWEDHFVHIDGTKGIFISESKEAFDHGVYIRHFEFSDIKGVQILASGAETEEGAIEKPPTPPSPAAEGEPLPPRSPRSPTKAKKNTTTGTSGKGPDLSGACFIVHLKRHKHLAHPNNKSSNFILLQASTNLEAQSWVRDLQQKLLVKANVYTVGIRNEFPEHTPPYNVKTRVAICFSGGGGRAHVCACGQLRALHHLKLLDNSKIDYISGVSAGAWATSIYTFYQSGAENDDELLGAPTSENLGALTMTFLQENPLPKILEPALMDMWKVCERYMFTTDPHKLWEKCMGYVFLKPFGLNHPNQPFALCTDVARIKQHNPQLASTPFITTKNERRPFWITHGTIIGPEWARLKDDLLPIQFTPIYTGSPYLHKMHYETKKKSAFQPEVDVWVGGGMVDSFAFGGNEPEMLSGTREELNALFNKSVRRRLFYSPFTTATVPLEVGKDTGKTAIRTIRRLSEDVGEAAAEAENSLTGSHAPDATGEGGHTTATGNSNSQLAVPPPLLRVPRSRHFADFVKTNSQQHSIKGMKYEQVQDEADTIDSIHLAPQMLTRVFSLARDQLISVPDNANRLLGDLPQGGAAAAATNAAFSFLQGAIANTKSGKANEGSAAPGHDDQGGVIKMQVLVPPPDVIFSLRHALSITSDAPSVNLHNRQLFQHFNVQQKYWTPIALADGRTGGSSKALVPSPNTGNVVKIPVPDTSGAKATGMVEGVEPPQATTTTTKKKSKKGEMTPPAPRVPPEPPKIDTHGRKHQGRRGSITLTHAVTMDMGDGGSLDNTGLLGMLQRRVRRNIVFLNTNTRIPLRDKFSGFRTRVVPGRKFSKNEAAMGGSDGSIALIRAASSAGGEEGKRLSGVQRTPSDGDGLEEETFTQTADNDVDMNAPPTYAEWLDDDILPLFGQEVDETALNYLGTHHYHNQVFPIEDLRPLLNALQKCFEENRPLVVRTKHVVQENLFWGIEGGWEVEILWCYLDDCYSFVERLPEDTREEIAMGMYGEFARFPNFLTFGQNKNKSAIEISLTKRQTNLLSTYCEWAVLECRDLFMDFVEGGEQAMREGKAADEQRRKKSRSHAVKVLETQGFAAYDDDDGVQDGETA